MTATKPWYSATIDKASVDTELAKRVYQANKTQENRKAWHRLGKRQTRALNERKEIITLET